MNIALLEDNPAIVGVVTSLSMQQVI